MPKFESALVAMSMSHQLSATPTTGDTNEDEHEDVDYT